MPLPNYPIKPLGYDTTQAFVSITLAAWWRRADAAVRSSVGPDRATADADHGLGVLRGLAYPLFLLVNFGSLVAAITACILAAIEAVHSRLRHRRCSTCLSEGCATAASRSATTCVAGFGGTTPYVVTWLTARTGNVMVPAFY